MSRVAVHMVEDRIQSVKQEIIDTIPDINVDLH